MTVSNLNPDQAQDGAYRGTCISTFKLERLSAETVYQQARADVTSTTTAIAQDRKALELLVGSPIDDASPPTELPPTAN